MVERVMLRSATNTEIRTGLDGTIPKAAIYLAGDVVRISEKLAAAWDAQGVTTQLEILRQPENLAVQTRLTMLATRNADIREREGIVRQDSPGPRPPAARPVEAKPEKAPAKKESEA